MSLKCSPADSDVTSSDSSSSHPDTYTDCCTRSADNSEECRTSTAWNWNQTCGDSNRQTNARCVFQSTLLYWIFELEFVFNLTPIWYIFTYHAVTQGVTQTVTIQRPLVPNKSPVNMPITLAPSGTVSAAVPAGGHVVANIAPAPVAAAVNKAIHNSTQAAGEHCRFFTSNITQMKHRLCFVGTNCFYNTTRFGCKLLRVKVRMSQLFCTK